VADAQTIDASSPAAISLADAWERFSGLGPDAFKCAVALELDPPSGPIGIAWIARLLAAGTTKARRVYGEMRAAGLFAVDRFRDAVTGRVHGQRSTWVRRAFGCAKPAPASAPTRALDLLRQLPMADRRLAFPERELESLVAHVVARFADGETDADVYTRLTARLPASEVTTGLLQWRLTHDRTARETVSAPAIPAQSQSPARVECDNCGRPAPPPLLNGLCADCHKGVIPGPPDRATRAARLAALTNGRAG